ncbi:unnamed protein product [Ceratitis capitata]|uniref:(Mediterranean fruit fly) hypothetical protein n=1 Tax=Ceratitis capitata TaxID=7213 RepID=A0A811UA35_CERCA|nr:unnamed protein product [Ceratitis capitata]
MYIYFVYTYPVVVVVVVEAPRPWTWGLHTPPLLPIRTCCFHLSCSLLFDIFFFNPSASSSSNFVLYVDFFKFWFFFFSVSSASSSGFFCCYFSVSSVSSSSSGILRLVPYSWCFGFIFCFLLLLLLRFFGIFFFDSCSLLRLRVLIFLLLRFCGSFFFCASSASFISSLLRLLVYYQSCACLTRTRIFWFTRISYVTSRALSDVPLDIPEHSRPVISCCCLFNSFLNAHVFGIGTAMSFVHYSLT